MKCFYHNADLDGKCSAAIVHHVYPTCELIGINYGDEFPWDTIEEGESIFMVDFSLQPFEEMIKLRKRANLIWIDHHKTVVEEYEKCRQPFVGTVKSGLGACALVWQWFANRGALDQITPYAVQLLAQYDVWDHSDPNCLPFQYGMRALECEPTADVWKDVWDNTSPLVNEIVGQGKAILAYEQKQAAIRASATSFVTELDGLRCLAMNHSISNSKVFDSVWDPEIYDAMLMFGWRKGQWTVSLYTYKDSIDVSEIAKARGGGGHKGAAGFRCSELPFTLW